MGDPFEIGVVGEELQEARDRTRVRRVKGESEENSRRRAVGFDVRLVGSALGRQVDRTLREFGLTATQLGALSHLKLASPDGLSGAQLAQRIGVTPQSMASAIAGLVSADLVRREAHPIHGRILEARITPPGLARRDAAQAAVAKVTDLLLGLLDAGQQQQLREILRVLWTLWTFTCRRAR